MKKMPGNKHFIMPADHKREFPSQISRNTQIMPDYMSLANGGLAFGCVPDACLE